MTVTEAAWYMAALIDGEGCVYFNEYPRRRTIQVTNSDEDILDAFEHACCVLGLKHSKRQLIHDQQRDGRQPCWSIRIIGGRQGFTRFLEVVPLQCGRKLATLKRLVASYIDSSCPGEAWLREHYAERMWTTYAIARHFDVTEGVVRYWMRRYGIKRRSKVEVAQLRFAA